MALDFWPFLVFGGNYPNKKKPLKCKVGNFFNKGQLFTAFEVGNLTNTRVLPFPKAYPIGT